MIQFFRKSFLLIIIFVFGLVSNPILAQVQNEDSVFTRWSLGFWGGMNNTFNTYSNGIGPHAGLRLRYNINPMVSLGVAGMLYRTGQSEKDYGTEIGKLEAVGSSNVAINIFSRFQFEPTSIINPYVLLGGTIHFPNLINPPANIALRGGSITGSLKVSYLDSAPILGLHTGIGTEIFLSKKVALDIGIGYQHLFGNRLAFIGFSQISSGGVPLEFDQRETGFLTINLGFSFHLGASGKQKSAEIPITIIQIPPPSINIQVSPAIAERGSEVAISWICTNADSVSLNGVFVSIEGQRVDVLNQSTSYEIVAYGKGGIVSKREEVKISEAPLPAIAFIVKPDTILLGETVSLAWNTNEAEEITLNGLTVAKSGNQINNPIRSLTFTLTASGKGGTVKKSQSVYVRSLKELTNSEKVILPFTFNLGESTLDSLEFFKLDEIANQLKEDSTIKIEISVQVDALANRRIAEKLSLERAQTIQNYLLARGILQDQVTLRIQTDRESAATLETNTGKSVQRKVEIKVLK
ncbi:MAG: outer membrane beta-barrel protein [Chloroherpetonaceae bacterium]|nr:outer membrane beta-barrel protein [Chloroherpetonaceae bacterium]